jgi:hypothetical protein
VVAVSAAAGSTDADQLPQDAPKASNTPHELCRQVSAGHAAITPAVSSILYQIPLSQLAAFRGRDLILRTEHPRDLIAQVRSDDLDNLAYVQLCGLPDDIDDLVHWAENLPIDLLLARPAADFSSLYRFAKLLENHPVRVSVPVEPGFEKAVKLAESLQFAVRLQVGQPEAALIESLARLLQDYLHRTTVTQPVEFFHSLLLGFCNREPISLWAIQEDDPALVRHIDEQGREHLPKGLTGADIGPNPERFVADGGMGLRPQAAECADCRFFPVCRGYFKWPRRDYDCAGVKTLLGTLEQAGEELREDLAAAAAATGEAP